MDGAGLKIRLFGDIAVSRDGTPIALPQSRKARALLAHLAVTAKPQRRDRLCDLFWQLSDDPKGSLRWSLSRIRPIVDIPGRERLIANRQTAELDLSDVSVDVHRLAELARAPDRASLEELQAMCDGLAGRLLEGLELPECLEYQSWLVAEREAARQNAVRVVRSLASRADTSDMRVGAARKLAAIAPELEDAYVTLVAALVAAGRRIEAEQMAEIGEALLREHDGAGTGAIARALSGAPSKPNTSGTDAGTAKPSIAVLPFANAGADIDDYLVDGIVDAITDALACYTWLFVIARQSAFAFKIDSDPRAVANALGVRYILAGSVLRGADRVRIVCRLFDGETGAQVWLERFDRDARDLFELQDDVSTAVASRLQPTIIAAETKRARHKPTASLDAYDYYLRALPYVYMPQGRGRADAIALLQESLKLDPDFAISMAMLANLRLQDRARSTPAGIEEALLLARRAVQLAQDDARVLSISGLVIGFGARDFDTADGLIDRALDVNPNSYAAWVAKGWTHIFWGEVTKAEACLDIAEKMSPRDPFHYMLQAARASALYQTGRFADAEVQARASALANPTFDASQQFLVASLVELGRIDEARAALGQLRKAAPQQDLTFLRLTLPYRPIGRADRFLTALARAGMPERAAGSSPRD